MATETRNGHTPPPFDAALSRRIDAIILRYDATRPKTISRGWARLQKRIAERHVPAWYGREA